MGSKKTPATRDAACDTKQQSRPTRAREPLPLSVRFNVLARDKFKCCKCGWSTVHSGNRRLEVDHIIPVAAGGTNDMDNLQTLCSACNRGKSAKLLEENGQTEAEAEKAEGEARMASIQKVKEQYMAIAEQRNARIDQANLAVDAVNDVFAVYTKGRILNLEERSKVADLIQEFGLDLVMKCMDLSFGECDNADTVLEHLGGFCYYRSDPRNMQQLLIKRMRRKLDGFNDTLANDLLHTGQAAAGSGSEFVFLDDVNNAIRNTPRQTPWKLFVTTLSDMVDEYKRNNND